MLLNMNKIIIVIDFGVLGAEDGWALGNQQQHV